MPSTGELGEEAAVRFLINSGFRVIVRNYRCPLGELDIVAEKDGRIHFVEVKASRSFPEIIFRPEVRVGPKKMAKLRRLCELYLSEAKAPIKQQWQIDVISVIIGKDGMAEQINYFDTAVTGGLY